MSVLAWVPASVRAPTHSSSLSLPQLPYRDGVVYGPIQSRRVGWSLGINLLGDDHRVCTFDCTYCQFPRPNGRDRSVVNASRLLRGEPLLEEIRRGIEQRVTAGIHFDSLSFVGNGDPSVHPDLLNAARVARTTLSRLGSKARMTIFTNAVPYRRDEFLEALQIFDSRLVKLDAADEMTFAQINRPVVAIDLDELVARLALVGGITIQTMVVRGTTDNRASIQTARFGHLVERAGADEVQLATIDKRPAFAGVLPAAEEELHKIARVIRQQTTVPVRVYFQDCPSGFPGCMPPHHRPGEASDQR